MPPSEWLASVPLPRLPRGFHDYKRDALCLPQAPLAGLSRGHRDFLQEVKGKSALALSRDLSVSYKAAFVLLHKLREAMAEEMKGRKLGGEGKEAETM
jgi:hypothetical protein